MDKFELTRTNKKSEVYENADYKVTIKEGAFGVTPAVYRCEDDGSILSSYQVMVVENKKTGKKAQTRVYQGNPLYDLQNDLEARVKFKREIWDKIG